MYEQGFADILESIAPLIYSEEEFIADFLQINDAGLTFADYMGLDNYYRRQASRAAGLQPATIKLVRGAMDLIFGFLPAEFKGWIDRALAKDNLYAPVMFIGAVHRSPLQPGHRDYCSAGAVPCRSRGAGQCLPYAALGEAAR
jgi:hypothetical protein